MARTQYRGNLRSLTESEVMAIRKRLITSELGRADFGTELPMRPDLLASAVSRQDTGFGGRRKYERPYEIAATLFYGIATNHAFDNGNKRTALVSYLVSLDCNGLDLVNTSEHDLYAMATQIVAHQFPIPSRLENHEDSEVMALASWTRARTAKKMTGARNTEFPELRKILDGYGCTFDSPSNNYLTIRNGSTSIKIGYPRENFTVPAAEVKRIHSHLGIGDVDGEHFFDLDLAVDEFVSSHHDSLTWLADA